MCVSEQELEVVGEFTVVSWIQPGLQEMLAFNQSSQLNLEI